MVKITFALATAFAIAAQAAIQAGSPQGDHPDYSAQQNYQPKNLPMPLPNSTYSKSTLSGSSVASSGSAGTSPASSATTPNSPITNSSPVGTGSSSIPSSAASSGFSIASNSSLPVGYSTVKEYTTEIVYVTVTTCPVTKTHGSGASASVEVTQTTSTLTITSTSTICTQCVAPPGTAAPSTIYPSDTGKNGPIAPYPTGGSSAPIGTGTAPGGTGSSGPSTITTDITSGGEAVTLTYTLGAGSSTTVVTTTIKNTKTQTNTHVSLSPFPVFLPTFKDPHTNTFQTVYATASPGAGSSPEQTTPENGSEGSGSNSSPENSAGSSPEESAEETSTIKHYITSTQYVTARPSTCPAQVTVTVPGPDVTVTVTSMGQPPSNVPGGPGSSSPPPFPTGGQNSTLPGTSSSGFITIPSASASFNPSPYSNLFPEPSVKARR
ncbi:uncharacterized protein KY384_006878 [Bacidia gigantensis]|uniref:uncharacterized protein n=1 Tax=Bacidia gigantensis TaxID=2732470 RepID=UPI001D0381C2|nr:uncharacterized protein KY384_006878 [Bacidia gigantensis]KAG8527962.1 hypothetical protein KY384_006878 [Bacidia gigantensis]